MNVKKKFSTVLCLLTAASLMLGGCSAKKDNLPEKQSGQGAAAQVAAGAFPIVSDKVTFKVVTPQNARVVDFNTNECTAWLEGKTNIHVDWNVVGDIKTTKPILLASGDLPDIFLGCSITREEEMIYGVDQKVFVPLNPYIEKYGIEIKKILTNSPGYVTQMTAPDGNVYALPDINEVYHNTRRNKMWIDTKWLKALNLQLPQTTEDFYQMLKAFKEKDPNGNKKQDEIPLGGLGISGYLGPVPYLMSSFITDDGTDHFVQPFEGKIDVIYNKPQFREGLRYINKLFKEKLLDQEFITQNTSAVKAKIANQEANLIGAFSAHSVSAFTDMNGDRQKEYDAIPPLKGPEGVQTTAAFPVLANSGNFLVTNKCKKPDVAFRWADFMYSDEFVYRWYFGKEGSEWRKAKPEEMGINGKPALYAPIIALSDIQNFNWMQTGIANRSSDWRLGQVAEQNIYSSAGLETRLYQATKQLYEKYGVADARVFTAVTYLSTKDSAEYNQLRKTILDYVNETIAKFITGDMSLDSDWDKHIKTLENMNLKRYIEILQNSYKPAK